MGVKQNPIKNDGTTITSPQWVSNISQIGVSAFVNDENYISNASINIGNVVYFQNLYASIALVNANLSAQVATLGNAISTINTTVQSLSNNTSVQISNIFQYVNQVQSNLYSNINALSNTLNTSISIINSNLIQQSNAVQIVSNSLSNCYSYVSNVSSTTSIQISNIKAQLINAVYVGNNISLFANDKAYQNVSQVSLSITNALSNVVYQANIANVVYRNSNVSLLVNDVGYITTANLSSNIVYYGNLYSTDVRKLSNTSNIVYTGSNISTLTNNSGYITANSSPTFNNITINGVANVGTVLNVPIVNSIDVYAVDEFVSNSIVLGILPNVIVFEVVAGRSGGNALKIAQDALGIGSLLMDGAGIAFGLGSALKSIFNTDGTPTDLEKDIEDNINSGNTAITIDWSQIRNSPLGYTGSTIKKVGIQSDMYMGGSLYYDSSIVDISENFYGSVQLNSTSNGVKMIDGQSKTAYFTDVKASGNVKTDDLRSYTSGTPIYCFNDLNGQGNLSSQLYISATKDISASGNTFTTNLVASQTVSGNLLRASAITGISGDKTTLYTDVDTTGNVRSFTNQIVYGVLTANSLSVSYDANFGSNIYTNNLFFGGNIYFNSSIVQFSQFTGNNKQISYGGNITTTGNIIANNFFLGTQNLYSYIQSVSPVSNIWIQTNGNAQPTANSIVSNTIYVSEIGTTNANNELIVRASQTRFVGNILVDPADITIEGSLYLWGNVVAGNSFVCNKECDISGNCVITSDIDIRGNINSLDESMWISANNLSLIGNVIIQKDLFMNSPLGNGLFVSSNIRNYIINTVGNTGTTIIYSNITTIYSNTITTNVIYSSNISSNSLYVGNATVSGTLFLNNITIAGNTLNTYITNITGNTSLLVSNAYIQSQYVSKTQGNAWYLSGSGYISNNTSYNAVVGSLNATSISVSGTNLTSIYQPIGSYLTSVPTGFSVASATFTTSLSVPYATSFNGKTSTLNNDAGFLTSVGTGYVSNNTSYNLSCGAVSTSTLTASGTITTSVGLGISMPTTGQSYIGWGTNYIGYCYTSAQFFSNASAGDIILRSSANNVLFGCYNAYNNYMLGCLTNGYVSCAVNFGIGTTTPAYPLDVSGTARATTSVLVGANPVNIPSTRTTYTILSSPSDTVSGAGVSANVFCRALQISAGTATGGMWNFSGAPNIYGSDLILTGGSLNDGGNNGTGPVNYYPGNVYIQSGVAYNGGGQGASGTIVFQTGLSNGTANYTERMRVHSNGYVGVGTNSPGTTLDVNGTIRGTNYIFPLGSWLTSTDGKNRFYFGAAGKTYYASASGDHEWRIDSAGSTMGMTLSATSGAIYTLGNGQFNNCKVGDPGFGGNYTAFGHSSSFGTNAYAILSDNAGGTYLNAGSGQPIYIRISNGDVGRWTTTGLGIGTTSPAYTLDVSGTGRFTGTLTSGGTASLASGLTITSGGGGTDVLYNLYAHSLATVNTTSVLNNAALTVAGNTYTTALQVGNYSTTSLVGAPLKTGIVQISNNASGTLGPHYAAYTNTDNYPITQILNYSHDNAYISFDMYYDTAWRTAYNAINYQISKVSGVLNFTYCNAAAAGSTITQTPTMTINQNKVCLNGSSTTYQFLINGYSLQDSLMAVFRNGTTNPVFNIQGTTVGINQITNSYNLDVNGNMRVVNGAYFNGSDNIAMGTISYLTPTATTYSAAFGGSTAGYAIIGGRIRGSQIDIFSDRRIKTDITPRDTAKDLEMLSKIPMRNYTYIDKIHHSAKPHLGVISQEIENIVPDAVNHSKHTIPDVYKLYDIVEIDEKTFTIVGCALEDKTKVRMYYEKGGKDASGRLVKNEIKFKGVVDGTCKIRHKQGILNTDKVFVYGKEVDDFKNVNYSHLYSMNIGATQELARVQRTAAVEISNLARRVEQLTGELKKCMTIIKELDERTRAR